MSNHIRFEIRSCENGWQVIHADHPSLLPRVWVAANVEALGELVKKLTTQFTYEASENSKKSIGD